MVFKAVEVAGFSNAFKVEEGEGWGVGGVGLGGWSERSGWDGVGSGR